MTESSQSYPLLSERLADPQNGLKGLKVGLVSSTFILGRSYQENLWAESLADLGAQVSVFIPIDRGSPQSQSPFECETPLGTLFHVTEVPSYILPRNQVLTSKLGDHLEDFAPQLVIWVGCIMFFGRALYLEKRLAQIPIITIYSLSRRGRHPFAWHHPNLPLSSRFQSFVFQTIRAPILTRTLKRAQLTIANTPECTDIIRQYIWGDERISWAKKHEEIPLGFCPHTFSYQPSLRRVTREALPINDQDIVMLFSSRFEENKWAALESVFLITEHFMSQLSPQELKTTHMLWIGANDHEVTTRFKRLLDASPFSDNHHLISFQSRQRLSTFYHAADIALFAQPSISCQEAMGTGLLVLCPHDPSLDHLQQYSPRLVQSPMISWADELLRICRDLRINSSIDEVRLGAATQAQSLSYTSLVCQTLMALSNRLTLP